MVRRFECESCAQRWKKYFVEESDEFILLVAGTATQPSPTHGISVNGKFFPLKVFMCDGCGDEIAAGKTAVAVTLGKTEELNEGGVYPAWWDNEGYIENSGQPELLQGKW